MPYTLRPYQQAAVEAGLRALQGGVKGAGILIEPVGSGKSLILANLVQRLDGPALIFQPNGEILEQNANKLTAYGYTPSVYSASMGMKEVGDLTLATIGSVKGLERLFDHVRYVLIDECDLVNADAGMYRDFLAALPPTVRKLGVTATPFRLTADGYGGSQMKFLTRTRPRVWTDVAHVSQIGDLLKQGFLCPLTYHELPFDRSALQPNSTRGDWTDRSVQQTFDRVGFRATLQRVVRRLLDRGRRSTLVFVRFVDDAEVLGEALVRAGVEAGVVTGATPRAVRRDLLDRFRAGTLPVVVNVGVLTAGFDHPALDTVVMARPTRSLRLWMQIVGRAVRTAPGKPDAWIVDMVGCLSTFGRIENMIVCAGGKRGQSWEFRDAVKNRPLTNIYYDRLFES